MEVEGEKESSVWFEANMEIWEPLIHEYTFPTKYISLSEMEIKSMILQTYKKCMSLNTGCEPPVIEEKNLEQQNQIISSIAAKVDQVMKDNDYKDIFVKLSSRSPKDATVCSERMDKLYDQKIQKKLNKDGQVTDNDKLIFLYESHIEALRVTSGTEAVELLTSSSRIYNDLCLYWQKYIQDQGKVQMTTLNSTAGQQEVEHVIQIIVRPWIPVRLQHEFRGIVYQGQLIALSQYYDHCFFSDYFLPQRNDSESTTSMKKKKVYTRSEELDNIFKIVSGFHANVIHPKLKGTLSNYIVDFALTEQKLSNTTTTDNSIFPPYKVWIIELNPYNESTDSCMFLWREIHQIEKTYKEEQSACTGDKGTFEAKNKYPISRVRDVEMKNVKCFVMGSWVKYFSPGK